MHSNLQEFFRQAKTLSLSPTERAQTRAALRAAQESASFELDPGEKASFRMQLQRNMHEQPFRPSLWDAFRLPSLRFVTAFCLMIAVIGGFVNAAQYALPGDFLYPVKINMNEMVIAKFLQTPEAQAAWAVERFERRLDEARQLEETMTEDTDEKVASLVQRYAEQAAAEVERVSAEEAEKLQTKMYSTLEVEERRLERLAERRPSSNMLRTVRELNKNKKTKRVNDVEPTIVE